MKNIKKIPLMLLAVSITFVMAVSIFTINGGGGTKVDTAEGESYLEAMANGDIHEIEEKIADEAGEEEPGKPYEPLPDVEYEEKELGVDGFYGSDLPSYVPWKFDHDKAEQMADGVADGTVSTKDVFSDTLFVGDSIMTGFSDFKLADEGNVLATVGAFLKPHLIDNVDAIINYGPKYLVVHYGINDMDPDDYVTDAFMDRYRTCLQQIKEGVPGIRIVVCGLMPVQDKAVEKNERFAYVEKYNKKIRQMCVDLGIGYNEDSELFASNPDLYTGDGIHVQKKLYVLWIDKLIREMGIC